MKEWFASATPEVKRTKENPPTISESLAILKTRFDKNSIIYEDWHKEEEEFAKYSFDENGNRVTTSTFLQELGGAEAPVPGAMPQAKPKTTTTIDELTKQLEKLTIAVNAVKDGTVERVPQPPATLEELRDRVDQLTQMLNNGGSGGFRMNQGSDSATRRCFMCGGICGENGTHPIGLRFCPETVRLVNEHLVTFDPQRMRYVMPDGRDLPVVPRGWAGGVASFIRNNQNNVAVPQSSASVPRDVPPHMRTTNLVGLVFEDAEVISGNVFALEGVPDQRYAFPTTRSGRDTSNRFDPLSRPADKGKAPAKPAQQPVQPQRQVRFESPPVSVQQPTAPAPPVIQQNSIPPPTNPINNEQGWKSSQPKNQKGGKDQDVEMKDKDKSPPGNQYHFTSKVQELADPQATFNRIGDMRVEVPLFQLLGMSPPLAKLFTESTRTKREYGPVKETVNKSAEYFSDSSEEQGYEALTEIYGTLGEESNEKHFCVMENDPKLDDLVFRCSNAMAQVPAKRFFAMTVGDLRVSINGVEFEAMIDSGSELNVAGNHLPEAASLPMDYDGQRWSLKGIHGEFERLRGCAVNAPIDIGGHDFSHHIFISRQSVGNHDIILGQPFLQWYSATIQYERGAHARLYLWKDGDRSTNPTLMVSITKPHDERNTAAIRQGIDKKKKTVSFIEEVDEGEEDF
ncbi:hypothetical protein F5878DRAFT_666780 [Lentinula raphanica]|uniref:DUF4100 domain-containing protein n=1 Tax=Lentinula raphanica TaxID=153919 RepID=A0AA38NX15_9AGAR|nr:hypothetical protein F5878DRAFT_666780 [Lentinula raphanica]